MTKIYSTTVELTPDGEGYIILPPELLHSVGWDEETLLDWHQDEAGNLLLSEHKEPKGNSNT